VALGTVQSKILVKWLVIFNITMWHVQGVLSPLEMDVVFLFLDAFGVGIFLNKIKEHMKHKGSF
jgi:hypothetical protein